MTFSAGVDAGVRYPHVGDRVHYIIRRDATVMADGYGIYVGRLVTADDRFELTVWQVIPDHGLMVGLLPSQGDEMKVAGP